ncbi:NADH dehydrogenase subunit J [Nitrosomonas marina]|uniref:NADH-quinone oxidoreductase subunit J n=1 Tax=Nitrosomonas marina TaxID=917 RepID=A0A1H9ZY33_9PROT|nr:NADH-quinone oxidoreductase subunit J [Nitrosomonas marina]SES86635.1 NADH dehydrogenase subunit J [Nitrosomonas marina]
MYEIIFYLTATVTVLAAGSILIVRNPIHAALYLVVALLALALLFFLLGAPLMAALQVMIYAGAIMVLFLFLIMVMNLRPTQEQLPIFSAGWKGPALLALILWLELLVLFFGLLPESTDETITVIEPKVVGESLFGPYLLVVEAAAVLLLAALIAVLYLSRKKRL